MAGFFVVVAILALILGFFGSIAGAGTAGLGAIGIAGVCMLLAIYLRADEHTTALLKKLDHFTNGGGRSRASEPTTLPPIRPDQR